MTGGPCSSAERRSTSALQDGAPQVPEQEASCKNEGTVGACTLLSHHDGGLPLIALGGHRGMGENLVSVDPEDMRPQRYRENTVRSLVQAAQAGASFVEFDVQVTADGVPVIWHDDNVVTREPGGRVVKRHIAQLTLAEFKGLARPQPLPPRDTPRGPPGTSPSAEASDAAACSGGAEGSEGGVGQQGAAGRGEGGGPGEGEGSLEGGWQLARLFRNTAGRALAGEQPWAVYVDDDLPTLAEVFQGVPESVGFDIEVKMTTPDDLAATPAAEVERMVSATLAMVEREAAHSDRTIIFSSFDPDVCWALRARQARFAVMFLSGGGAYAHVDARRTSVGGALDWALQAGLQGLVLEAGAVQAQPDAVASARSEGLLVLTYGRQNNEPGWVRQQALLGVHAVIVDDVKRIAAALHSTPDPVAA